MMKKWNKTFIYDKKIPLYLRLLIHICIIFISKWWYILLLYARVKKKNNKYKYYVSICAIFKDESLSLKEWIEYHLIIGVDHFYLYNNFSSDNYKEILLPYMENGIITLTEWPVNNQSQVSAYKHFHKDYWSETQWVAFIDIDEYICPKYADNLKEWLKPFEKYSSVVIYWKQFGSSGEITHDNRKLITEQYYISWEKYYDLGKTIFNTSFEIYDISPKYIHTMPASIKFNKIKLLIPPVNEFRKFVHYESNRIGIFHNIHDFTIQINHYSTKSYNEFFINKRNRGIAVSTGEGAKHIRSYDAYNFVNSFAITSDYTIQRYIIKLKRKMDKNICNYDE